MYLSKQCPHLTFSFDIDTCQKIAVVSVRAKYGAHCAFSFSLTITTITFYIFILFIQNSPSFVCMCSYVVSISTTHSHKISSVHHTVLYSRCVDWDPTIVLLQIERTINAKFFGERSLLFCVLLCCSSTKNARFVLCACVWLGRRRRCSFFFWVIFLQHNAHTLTKKKKLHRTMSILRWKSIRQTSMWLW